MGPKYEFTDETMNYDGHLLHRIKRLSDNKLGGWIEKEENLSQKGNCWVDDDAIVCDDAQVYGNAKVYDEVLIYGNSKVYGNAKLYDNAKVGGCAYIYDNAQVAGRAKVYGNAQVYGNASVSNDAKVYGNADLSYYVNVWGNTEVRGDVKLCGTYYNYYEFLSGTVGEDSTNENIEVLKDFIYKIDDSSKLDVQTSYDSVEAFFEDDSEESYVEHECLTIIAVDTKMPIIKLEKTQVKDKNIFKFVVDITNDDGDNYSVKAVVETKDKFEQLLKSTVEALNSYPQFSKYVDDLENCI